MTSYANVARSVFGTPWYVLPEQLQLITAIVQARIAGERPGDAEIAERVEAAQAAQGARSGRRTSGAVAVIPVYGTLIPRANLFAQMSGATSVEQVRNAFREAMADETIGSILLEFDSPGGQVDGIDELATEIRDARGSKPIVAIANTLCASAAYYLAAQADEVVATPSAMVGSIGTVMVHLEESTRLATEGTTATVIRSQDTKYEGNAFEPLTEGARAHLQAIVDGYDEMFVKAVAKGLGMPPERIRGMSDRGRAFMAKAAQAKGLVDRVETIDETIRRMASGRTRIGRATTGAIDAAAIADALEVPEALLEETPVEADAHDEREAFRAELSARLELDRDAWLFNS